MAHSTQSDGDGAIVVAHRHNGNVPIRGFSASLLPCPFCGTRPQYEIKRHSWGDGATFEIWCQCLRACVVESTKESAVRRWNQRPVGRVSLLPALKSAGVAKGQSVRRRKVSRKP